MQPDPTTHDLPDGWRITIVPDQWGDQQAVVTDPDGDPIDFGDAVVTGMLRSARLAHGHNLQSACAAMRVSHNSAWRWEHAQRTPTGLYRQAVLDYILAAEGKDG
jgi:hypothetical protein